jgi:hypothetical protein
MSDTADHGCTDCHKASPEMAGLFFLSRTSTPIENPAGAGQWRSAQRMAKFDDLSGIVVEPHQIALAIQLKGSRPSFSSRPTMNLAAFDVMRHKAPKNPLVTKFQPEMA